MQKAVIVASRENKLTSLAKALEARGIEAVVVEREDIRGLETMEKKAEEIGKIDYLVISSLCDKKFAGKNLAELEIEEYREWKYYALRQFYEINATFVKRMIENGGGKILGLVSAAGATPTFGECMNGGAGAALFMGLQCVAEESFEDNIFTTTVAIGATDGDTNTFRTDEQVMLHVPSHAMMSEEKVMDKVAGLMLMTGEEMTGNLINLDAGLSCAFMREW